MHDAGYPHGWSQATLGELLFESSERAGVDTSLHVLSVTKHQGVVPARDRFARALHGKDLSRYRVARKNNVVIDPMLLWDGVIAVQERFDAGLVSPDYRVFEIAPSIEPAFFKFLARAPYLKRQYRIGARGTNVRRRRINREDFLRISVMLPPLAEQRKIASVLDSVDNTIEKTKGVIDQLENVKKQLLSQMLTRGWPGRHKEFTQTEIGEIPVSWRWLPLRELVSFCDYGLSCSLSSDPVGTPVLRMGNLYGGELIFDDLKFASGVDDEFVLEPGDVLFNRTNSADRVGKVGVFRGQMPRVTFASYLLRLRARPEQALGEWLSLSLNTEANQRRLRALATPGVSQVNVNREKLLSMEIPVPPIEEQEEFLAPATSFRERLAAEGLKLVGLQQLKAALLTAMLSGEVRVQVPMREAS